MAIRVLLVDDHAMVRSALRVFLSLDPEIQVIGEAGDGHEALAAVEQQRPDLVLMDISMPGMPGMTATREIRQRFPEVEVLVLSSGSQEADLVEALQAGARGYLLKNGDASQLLRAVKTAMVTRLPCQAPAPAPQEALTEREEDVMRLVAEGLSNQEIGERLAIAERTVRCHVSQLLAKLGARSRAQIAMHSWKRKKGAAPATPAPAEGGP